MIRALVSVIAEKIFESSAIDLKNYLNDTKKVKINGVIFHIRKINVLDYLEGARVLNEFFSVYKTKDEKNRASKENIDNLKKAKGFMRDVIMAGVVKPKLVRKQSDDPEAIVVDDIFQDFVMAQKLSKEILDYTHHKKKVLPF
jgi:hypothetical protein